MASIIEVNLVFQVDGRQEEFELLDALTHSDFRSKASSYTVNRQDRPGYRPLVSYGPGPRGIEDQGSDD